MPGRGSNECILIVRAFSQIRVRIYKRNVRVERFVQIEILTITMQSAKSNGIEAHVLSQVADLLVQGCAASAIVFFACLKFSEHILQARVQKPLTVSKIMFSLFRVWGFYFPYMCYASSVLASKPLKKV